jgi:hypothetical protein
MSSFIPSGGLPEESTIVPNDGWYPDLTVSECRASTGLGTVYTADRVAAELLGAMMEVNAGLTAWRARQSASSLAGVPGLTYGEIPEKVALYKAAVFASCRARMIDVTRDYDSTKSGHNRADALVETADSWRQRASEALSRLTDRPRTTVELI